MHVLISFQVEQKLQEYDITPGRMISISGCNWCWEMPTSIGGEDVKDVFNDAGLFVFTDANVYDHHEGKYDYKKVGYNRL